MRAPPAEPVRHELGLRQGVVIPLRGGGGQEQEQPRRTIRIDNYGEALESRRGRKARVAIIKQARVAPHCPWREYQTDYVAIEPGAHVDVVLEPGDGCRCGLPAGFAHVTQVAVRVVSTALATVGVRVLPSG